MRWSEAIPIATAVVALAAVASLGRERRRTGKTPLLLLFGTTGATAAIGWASATRFVIPDGGRSVEALSAAALGSAAVMIAASLVICIPLRGPVSRSSGSAAANTALWSGELAVALLLIALRKDPSVLVAAVPAIVGVLGVWLGVQSLAHPDAGRDAAGRARVAIELVLAIALSLGAIACASIAAACAVLRARPDAGAEALGTLARATTFALPLAFATGIALSGRLADVGRSAPRRVRDLVAAACTVVIACAGMRVQLGSLLRTLPEPRIATAAPPPIAPVAAAPLSATPAPPPPEPSVPDAGPTDDSSSAVALGKVSVSGMLAPPEVERGVQKMEKLVQRCVDQASDGGHGGNISVKFTIGPNGSVANVQDDPETSIENDKLVSCVLASFYQIGFPRPTRGYVRVELPITIRAP